MTTGLDLDRHALRFWGDRDTRQIFKILCFLHFANNSQGPEQSEEYDQLWKLRTVFDTLDDKYAKLYNPSEKLAVDEVIVKYSGRVIWQYIPKKRKRFGIKIYKLCDEAGYTCAMRSKDSQSATDDMTAETFDPQR